MSSPPRAPNIKMGASPTAFSAVAQRLRCAGRFFYEKTKGQVLVDAGFNLVRVSMNVNSDDTRSGVVDTTKPLEVRHDRSQSADLDTAATMLAVPLFWGGLPFDCPSPLRPS